MERTCFTPTIQLFGVLLITLLGGSSPTIAYAGSPTLRTLNPPVRSAAPSEECARDSPIFCVTVAGALEVCKCHNREEESAGPPSLPAIDGGALFVVREAGKVLRAWAAASYMGDVEGFQVLSFDAVGKKDPVIIIANFASTGVGLSPSTWEVSIVENVEDAGAPLTFVVDDYNREIFSFNSAGSLRVLITEWLSLTPHGGSEGYYFTGQTFVYGEGALTPAENEKPRLRRLSKRFETAVAAERSYAPLSGKITNRPAFWLASNESSHVAVDPELQDAGPAEERAGTIESVTTETGKDGIIRTPTMALAVRFNDGAIETLRYDPRYFGPSPETRQNYISRFGVLTGGASQRVLPRGYYSPALVTFLTNAAVRLSRFKSSGGAKTILWMQPRETRRGSDVVM